MHFEKQRRNLLLPLRQPEPELMESPEQIRAYDEADFSVAHDAFVDQFALRFGCIPQGRMIDLGCGPGDLTVRWARKFPHLSIDAVDASLNMIRYAQSTYAPADNVHWHCASVPLQGFYAKTLQGYDVVVSNSLLHHLGNPSVLWSELRRVGRSGSYVLIGDLVRPESTMEAGRLVRTYASDAAPVLKKDFFNSLCAAYTISEVASQLREHKFDELSTERVSDRHLLVWGRLS